MDTSLDDFHPVLMTTAVHRLLAVPINAAEETLLSVVPRRAFLSLRRGGGADGLGRRHREVTASDVSVSRGEARRAKRRGDEADESRTL